MGVSQEVMGKLHREATAGFTANLDGEASATPRQHLLSLAEMASRARLPPASVIRRAGRKRRQTHTAVAAAAAVTVAIGSGAVAYRAPQTAGALRAAQIPHAQATDRPATPHTTPSSPDATPSGSAADLALESQEALPSADDLLDEDQITRLGLGQEWRVTRTHDNTNGRGINTTWQQSRFADPDGVAALVRTFAAKDGNADRSVVQTMEISKSARQAEKAFATTVGWYAGCQVGRLQLLSAYRVNNIGDQAQVLIARAWEKPVTTYSVAVARTGRIVTSTVGKNVGAQAAPPAEISQSLADAVSMLCAEGGPGDCAGRPTFTAVPLPPSGEERGILAVADLPPIGRVDEPWVGTDAIPARVNPSATICDRTDFTDGVTRTTRTLTFLIPGAKLPDRFGISETYGVFRSPRAAARFLEGVRTRIARCEDRVAAADVRNPGTAHDPRSRADSMLWDVETEIADDVSVLFRLGFVRVGAAVAQVTFSPSTDEDMSRQQFGALVVRAGHRLRELG